jgi:hypothetical protein
LALGVFRSRRSRRFLERGKSEINEVLPQLLYYSHYVRADLSDEATSDNRTMAYWSAKSERVRDHPQRFRLGGCWRDLAQESVEFYREAV